MAQYPTHRPPSMNRIWVLFLVVGSCLHCAHSSKIPAVQHNWQATFFPQSVPRRGPPARRGPPQDSEGKVPLVVTNRCESTIWPGIATQAGAGPGTGGFELEPGESKRMWVSSDWQGRVWGRTNCTVNGESCACQTGDCFARLDYEFSVSEPV